MSGSPETPEGGSSGANARLIAAQAKSLRAELMREPGAPAATCRDLANVVELVELLATEVADPTEAGTK